MIQNDTKMIHTPHTTTPTPPPHNPKRVTEEVFERLAFGGVWTPFFVELRVVWRDFELVVSLLVGCGWLWLVDTKMIQK